MTKLATNPAGRVRNYNLPAKRALDPLAEAVSNALDAIREKDPDAGNPGSIRITAIRGGQTAFESMRDAAPITSFRIEDNGAGFTEENMNSFATFDSDYKAKRGTGGKGIGRLSWLKAYEYADVDSVYMEDGQHRHRAFRFSLDSNEIEDTYTETDQHDVRTVVTLANIKAPYAKQLPKQLEKIAEFLMRRFIIPMLDAKSPRIVISEQDAGSEMCLNDMCLNWCKECSSEDSFSVNGREFTIRHIRMSDPNLKEHAVWLCADGREVRHVNIADRIPDLDAALFNEKGYWYIGIITGEYLNDHVDPVRAGFDFEDKRSPDLIADVTMDDILAECSRVVQQLLSADIAPITAAKKERVQHILHDRPELNMGRPDAELALNSIKPADSDDEICRKLSKERAERTEQARRKIKKVLESLDGGVSLAEYEDRIRESVDAITEANQSALAQFVSHRKAILDLFEKGLQWNAEGEYVREGYIHDLIFPRRETNETISFDEHNLWMIDERLAYFSYIASDIPLEKNGKRPDVLLLDNAVAFAQKNSGSLKYDTLAIFEFKRPQRDGYTREDNPVDQMLDYWEMILDGKRGKHRPVDNKGRPIELADGAQTYLYAVCDVTPKLEKILGRKEFTQTPDREGWYKFFQRGTGSDAPSAYIEVIPLSKVLRDARIRNRIYFERLGFSD